MLDVLVLQLHQILIYPPEYLKDHFRQLRDFDHFHSIFIFVEFIIKVNISDQVEITLDIIKDFLVLPNFSANLLNFIRLSLSHHLQDSLVIRAVWAISVIASQAFDHLDGVCFVSFCPMVWMLQADADG